MSKVLIIVPVFNEEESIVSVVESLRMNIPHYDYLIVNDGSSDRTVELCRQAGYRYLDLPINVGLSAAVQLGYVYAHQNGYEIAIQFDGDGQHRWEYLEPLVRVIEAGANIAIGSRYLEKKKPWDLRMIGSRLISQSIWVTTGIWIQDPTSGMRAIDKELIEVFAYQMNHPPEPDTIAYQLNQKRRVREVQVEMDERLTGKSYLSAVNSIKYMLRILTSILLIQRFRQ